MEEQVLQLLAQTQSAAEGPRKQAELQLKGLQSNEAFPISLCSIASHTSVPFNLRQSALLYLKTLVLSAWSPSLDNYKGEVTIDENVKPQIRDALLKIATSEDATDDRKVKAAASYVVSKIASADFPDQWPNLLPTLLHLIPTATPPQLHGALKVLSDLVEDGLSEEQFFAVARDLVKVVYDVSVDESRKPVLRALAVSVFRNCVVILEMVMDSHRAAVKAFADEALAAWLPFFLDTLKKALPATPKDDDDGNEGEASEWRGVIALKLQVVKTLMKIRSVFPTSLSPQSPALFSATWQELSTLQGPYRGLYIADDRQGRLEDADGLPYTLDFLVLEELDFMQACLRAPPVRKELEKELQSPGGANGAPGSNWLIEVMKLAVAYAQITTEEEGLWDIDVNIFLLEETSVTANYTPRTACGDLVIKLGEWLHALTAEALLTYTKTLFADAQSTWKAKEAALYVLNQLLGDFQDVERTVGPELSHGFAEYVRFATQQEHVFLRARGYLVAGVLTRTSTDSFHEVANAFMHQALKAITDDPSEVVKVSAIRVLQDYLQALPPTVVQPLQGEISNALAGFFSAQDTDDLSESDDLMVTLVETLRDTIRIDTTVCIAPGSSVLDLLFTLASKSPNNFQLTMLVNETFEDIASSTSANPDEYRRLCEKVLPTLTGAFDVGDLTGESALTNLAADLLSVLAENGSSPLPQGFVAATLPKLNRLLLSSTDGELLRPGTEAVKYMLQHDATQLLGWHEPQTNKSGLEVCLIIIDRLLQEGMDDHAAAQVGGLAAELVEKAGSDKLGPFLLQLLRAVAVRLASAKQAAFIQSLILVFARLCLVSAKDVVDFLAQVQVGNDHALQVVMSKWLENSVNFAGYDEIRQNVIALSNLYTLNDPRLAQITVQGDLIVPKSDRIMTRSKAKQNPDQYTHIPLPLKIIKVLIQELSLASGPFPSFSASSFSAPSPNHNNLTAEHLSAAQFASAHDPASLSPNPNAHPSHPRSTGDDDDEEEADDWEDLPSDLPSRSELLAFGHDSDDDGDDGEGYGRRRERERDDETQRYLVGWFKGVVGRDEEGWRAMLAAEGDGGLSVEERRKLEGVLAGRQGSGVGLGLGLGGA